MTYTPDVWASIIAEGTGGGAGGGAFYVNLSYVGSSLIADKTFEEVDAAYTAGQIVIGIYSGCAAILVPINGAYKAEYHNIDDYNEVLWLVRVNCDADNGWTIVPSMIGYQLTPYENADDV